MKNEIYKVIIVNWCTTLYHAVVEINYILIVTQIIMFLYIDE